MTFIENKYRRWYVQIIDRARSRMHAQQMERHHVIPRSLGGGNERSNIVSLTFREHFLVHWLLTKFVNGPSLRKMQHALGCMRLPKPFRPALTSRQYEISKIAGRNAQTGTRHSADTIERMSKTRKGRRHSQETIEKMRAAATGRRLDAATKQKIGFASRNRDPLSIAQMAESLRGNRNASGSVRSEDNRSRISASLRDFFDKKKVVDA